MANLILNIVLWVVLGGFVTFCGLYVWLAAPWRSLMGKHELFIMGGFAIAFIYAVVSRYVPNPQRTYGWIIILSILAFMVWWRVGLLIRFQMRARKSISK